VCHASFAIAPINPISVTPHDIVNRHSGPSHDRHVHKNHAMPPRQMDFMNATPSVAVHLQQSAIGKAEIRQVL
jgi:hypothetical protein